MFSFKVLFSLFFYGLAHEAYAAALVEKSGRFEINWSTSKMRFYGTSILDPKQEDSWRSAEQKAWSDGITYLQQNAPDALSKRSGLSSSEAAKLTNAIAATSSVNTTYFGDSRIKVSLESSIADLFKEVIASSPKGSVVSSPSSETALLVKVSNKATPTAVFAVVDETGVNLVSDRDMAATAVSSSSISRWYKSRPEALGSKELPENTPELKATAVRAGVLQVAKADWKPEYAGVLASGRAAIVVP